MNKKGNSGWWPQVGLTTDEVNDQLRAALAAIVDYSDPEKPALSFPGANVDEIGISAWKMFAGRHPNNIGCHTSGDVEKGFAGTQLLEKEVIYMAGAMLHAKNPKKDVDGYIATGGTGGNIQGLWQGRNHHQAFSENAQIITIATELTHCSVFKATEILGLTAKRSFGRHRIISLPINKDGSMNMEQLDQMIQHYLNMNPYCRFIIVPTLGTTMTGGMDNLEKIDQIVQRHGRSKFYVHLDAAQGGFVYPFLYPEKKICFDVSCVNSTVVDVHKMGLGPYSSALFLCRKGGMEEVGTKVKYINSMFDGTLIGSRSGAIAASVWAIMKSIGWEGYVEINKNCMEVTNWLHGELKRSPIVVGLTDPIVNQLAFAVDPNLKGDEFHSEEKGRFNSDIESNLCLAVSEHPNPLDSTTGENFNWYKLPVMPGRTREHYSALLKLLRV